MNRATPSTGAAPSLQGGPGQSPRACPPRASTRILGPASHRGAGVAIGFDELSDEFRVSVLTPEGETIAAFGPFPEEEVVALWRGLSRATGLPLLVERPEGGLARPYPQLGPLALGTVRIRRRHGLLSGRRPRFLVRRKTGAWPRRPAVHRNREIIGHRR